MYLSEGIAKITYFLFMGILLLNIAQKRSGKAGMGKRTATLYLGIAILSIYLGAGAILYAPRLFRTPTSRPVDPSLYGDRVGGSVSIPRKDLPLSKTMLQVRGTPLAESDRYAGFQPLFPV
jgi:hypothetical protein